jgi:hypothetical protein
MTLLLLYHGGVTAVVPPSEGVGVTSLHLRELHRAHFRARDLGPTLRLRELGRPQLTIKIRED